MLPLSHPSLSCSWLAILLDGFAQLNIHAGHRCQNRKTREKRKPNEPVGRLNPTARKPFMVVNSNYYYYYY